MKTVVHLLRHGEVDNPQGVLYGRMPGYHLSDLGHRMAEAVARHLADHDVAVVVASSLTRAQETAAPVAAEHGLEVTTDDRVIEAANLYEGLNVTANPVALAHPRHWAKLVNPFKPSWGEPYVVVGARMLEAVAEARDRARGHEAVIVSHQLPIWTARNALMGRRLWHDPRVRQCSLASLTTLTYDDDELESVTYSEPAAALLPRARKGAGA